MSTVVQYNNVTISNCQTRTFSETVEYDPSGTDVTCHRFTIGVVGWVHTVYNCPTVNMSTNLPGATATNQISARTLLMEARKPFLMTVGGATLLAVNPSSGSISPAEWGDVDNGPKPKDFRIEQIVGTATMRVYFEIEVAVVECANNTNVSGILSNRWALRTIKDGNFYTTRTLNGRLRLVSPGVTVAAFQSLVWPTLAKGYRRESIEVTASLDGLVLDYVVTDRERFASPPSAKVTEWTGTHTISTGDGVTTHDELHVRFEAPKDADKAEMLEDLLEVVRQKLDLDNATTFLEQGAIIDNLQENVIEARVLVMRNPATDSQLALLNLPTKNFAKPLNLDGYDKDAWRLPSEYKTQTPMGLLVAFLQSPCSSDHSLPTSDTVAEQASDDERNTNVHTYTYTTDPPKDASLASSYSSDARLATYTFYDLWSEYIIDQNVLQLPIAASSTTTDDTSVFVPLAPPTGRRRITVHAQRAGQPPLLPDPRDVQLNGRHGRAIRDQRIRSKAPPFTANGKTAMFESWLEFTAGFAKPPSVAETLAIGSLPWTTLPVESTAMQPGNFVTELV